MRPAQLELPLGSEAERTGRVPVEGGEESR
jgi:hypothetical protein